MHRLSRYGPGDTCESLEHKRSPLLLGKAPRSSRGRMLKTLYSMPPQQGTFPHRQRRDNGQHRIVPGCHSERGAGGGGPDQEVSLIVTPLNCSGRNFPRQCQGFCPLPFRSCMIYTCTPLPSLFSSPICSLSSLPHPERGCTDVPEAGDSHRAQESPCPETDHGSAWEAGDA